ncbi:MAG: type II toxin-antitoxin system VapC family toxin [Leptolyngbya sp. BL-A-14]
MSGNENSLFVLDTNIILYFLGGRLADSLPLGQYFVSIISEIELLSYSRLSAIEENEIRLFLAQLTVVGIEQNIKNLTIELRKQHRLRLPDAVIVATTKPLSATLLTNDVGLTNIAELEAQSMPLL